MLFFYSCIHFHVKFCDFIYVIVRKKKKDRNLWMSPCHTCTPSISSVLTQCGTWISNQRVSTNSFCPCVMQVLLSLQWTSTAGAMKHSDLGTASRNGRKLVCACVMMTPWTPSGMWIMTSEPGGWRRAFVPFTVKPANSLCAFWIRNDHVSSALCFLCNSFGSPFSRMNSEVDIVCWTLLVNKVWR